MRISTTLVTAISVPCLLGACATAQHATTYDVARLGDSNLSCDEIYAEVNTLQANRNKTATDADKANTTAYAVEGAGTAALFLAPLTGGLSLLATGGAMALGMSAGDQTINAANMNERAQHLTKMFNDKGCKAPIVTASSAPTETAVAPEAAAPTKQTISTARAGNLYQGPSVKSGSIRELPKGAVLYPTSNKSGTWQEVATESGEKGWVPAKILQGT